MKSNDSAPRKATSPVLEEKAVPQGLQISDTCLLKACVAPPLRFAVSSPRFLQHARSRAMFPKPKPFELSKILRAVCHVERRCPSAASSQPPALDALPDEPRGPRSVECEADSEVYGFRLSNWIPTMSRRISQPRRSSKDKNIQLITAFTAWGFCRMRR